MSLDAATEEKLKGLLAGTYKVPPPVAEEDLPEPEPKRKPKEPINNAHYEQFQQRRLQEELVVRKPSNWHGTDREWQTIKAEAEDILRGTFAMEYLTMLKKGWRPHEISSGKPDPGAQTNVVTGHAVRPLPSTATAEQEEEARRLLRELAARHTFLPEAPLQADLEAISQGRYTSQPQRIDVVLAHARGHISAKDAVDASERVRGDSLPWVRVFRPFPGPGGQKFQPGRFQIMPEKLAELQDWQSRMEQQRDQRGWEYPSGFHEWPVFEVIDKDN